MIRRRKNICMILIFILSMLIVGCNQLKGEGGNPEQMPEEKRKPVVGGELVLPITQFDTLNPMLNKNESVYFFNNLIYDGLIQLDGKLQAQPALATEWTPTEDGAGWIFQLRSNVFWHDGQPFTAEDVKFTIDTLKLSETSTNRSIYSGFVKGIKSTKILSENRILIEMDSPINSAIEIFQFPIIPKHKFRNSEEVYKEPKDLLVGTGRYKVDAYKGSKYIKLAMNEGYWENKPYVPTIIGKIVPDYAAALTSVEANETSLAKATDFDWEKYSEDKTLKIYEYTTLEYEFLSFNFNKELLADKNIRTAIAYSIDRPALVNEVYLGHATITDTPVHPHSWLYDESAKKYGKEVEKAKKILEGANWRDEDKDGILENEGGKRLTLHLLVNHDNPQRVETADLIASQLKEIGMEVIVEKVNWEEYQYRLFANRFDIALGGWKLSTVPDLSFALHSAYKGSTNFTGYAHPEMDRLLVEAAMAKSSEVRKQKYKEIQKRFIEDLPYFSLFFKNSALIAKDYVKGNVDPRPYNIYYSIDQWYVLDEAE